RPGARAPGGGAHRGGGPRLRADLRVRFRDRGGLRLGGFPAGRAAARRAPGDRGGVGGRGGRRRDRAAGRVVRGGAAVGGGFRRWRHWGGRVRGGRGVPALLAERGRADAVGDRRPAVGGGALARAR